MIKVAAVSTSSTLSACHIFRLDESRPFSLVSFLLVLERIRLSNLENFVILHARLGDNQVLCYIIMQGRLWDKYKNLKAHLPTEIVNI